MKRIVRVKGIAKPVVAEITGVTAHREITFLGRTTRTTTRATAIISGCKVQLVAHEVGAAGLAQYEPEFKIKEA